MSVGSSRAAPEGALVEVDLRAPVRLAGAAATVGCCWPGPRTWPPRAVPAPRPAGTTPGSTTGSSGGWPTGGQGLAPASLRVEVAAVRVLLRQLGMHEVAAELTTEGHRPAPPDTITPEDYDRLLRMPDRRRRLGVRDQTVLRILGDTGLRSAELRGLCVRHVERARTDSRHRRLRIVRGKGGRGRLVELTAAADAALDNWLARHPDARGVGGGRRLPPEDAPLFCTLGRGGHDPGRPLSAAALNRLAARHAKAAGIAAHLRHPT
jgi:integrase